MALSANSAGVLTGKFTIPENIRAGSKRVVAVGEGGSRGEAIFVGQGALLTQTWAVRNNVDPLAQTFSIDNPAQIGGIDLWFTAKGTSTVVAQIRETTVGIPNQTILAESRIAPTSILINGTSTRLEFPAPVMLNSGQEYALVVMCDDSVSALAMAELGKWDANANRWVTSQPYQVGVLLSSSNASTWTPHQDRDMTFRLLRNHYTEMERQVPLGSVAVTDTTYLLLMAFAEQPSAQAFASYRLGLPDGTSVTVADNQPVRLPAAITGTVSVTAILKGTADVSPVLYPGSQLVFGKVSAAADYISRAIPAGSNVRVRVIFDALIPAGAAVTVAAAGVDAGDPWQAVSHLVAKPLDNGWREMTHELTGVTETMLRVKLTLSGTTAARPKVRNLRVIVL